MLWSDGGGAEIENGWGGGCCRWTAVGREWRTGRGGGCCGQTAVGWMWAGGRRVAAKLRHLRRRRVVMPMPGNNTEAIESSDGIEKSKLAQSPLTMSRPSERLFSRVPPDMARRYADMWLALHDVHAEMMAVAIQALVRGRRERGEDLTAGKELNAVTVKRLDAKPWSME